MRYGLIILALTLAGATTGCQWFDLDVAREDKREGALDVDSTTASTVDADSPKTQTLNGTGKLKDASVDFPPGTLATSEEVVLTAGGDLSSESLSELSLDTEVTNAGTSLIVDSGGAADPVGTLLVTVPQPAPKGGLSLADTEILVVVYKVVIKATGDYKIGVLTEADFDSVDKLKNTVTIPTNYFGQFQALYISKEIPSGKEVSSSQSGFKSSSGDYIQSKVNENPSDPGPTDPPDDPPPVKESDTLAPSATISSTITGPTNATSIPFTISFTEEIKGFTQTDISVTSGTITNFVAEKTKFDFTVENPNDGNLVVSIAAGVATDLAGNPTPAQSRTLLVDLLAPTLTFATPPAGYVMTFADETGLVFTGTCSEPAQPIVFSGADADTTETCAADGTFSTTLIFTGSTPGDLTITGSTVDLAGNPGAGTTNVFKMQQVTVAPRFANATEWMTKVQSDNTTACIGSELGYWMECRDGGDRRIVTVTGETDCDNLTLTEDLGLFEWKCDDAGDTQATFYSKKKPSTFLSDLIDASGATDPEFFPNYVYIEKNGLRIAESLPAAWWNQDLGYLNDPAGSVVSLNTAGKIWVVRTNITTNGIYLQADRTGLVVMPGFTVTGFTTASPSCSTTDGSDTSPNQPCLVHAGGTNFHWIEGMFEADASEYYHGIFLHTVKFPVLENVRVKGAGYVTGGAAISINTGGGGLLKDITVFKGSYYGLYFGGGSVANAAVYRANLTEFPMAAFKVDSVINGIAQNINASNNAGAGIYVDTASNWSFNEVVAIANSSDGVKIANSMQTALMNASIGVGSTAGLVYENAQDHLVASVHSFNNSDSAIKAQGSPSNNNFFIWNLAVDDSGIDFPSGSFSAETLTVDNNPITRNGVACSLTAANPDGSCTADSDGSDTLTALAGAAAYISLLDLSGLPQHQAWVKDSTGNDPSDPAIRGNCNSGTCEILDVGYNAAYTGDLADKNGTFTADAACPINGNDVFTHNGMTFLKAAIEIPMDDEGNDNGLCESNEVCIFAPHIGAYQGHGPIPDTCTWTNGSVTGVTLHVHQNLRR